MFRHLYGLRYLEQELGLEERHIPGFHLEVLMLGDKYDIR